MVRRIGGDTSLRVRFWALLVGLVAVLLCASAATSTVNAAAYAYDAPLTARVDLRAFDAANANAPESWEGSGSLSVEARGSSTTSLPIEA